jgi:mono/diheme cytochrome c family protein
MAFGNFKRLSSVLVVLLLASHVQAQEKAKKITYDDHVQAIFRAKCASCHNPDKKSGGLDLTNYTNLMLGGSSGDVVDPGSAEDSYLYMLITHESEPAMPPNSPKLGDDVIGTIASWLDGGALENSGSKPVASKPKVNLKMELPAGQRPAVAPLPPHLTLEPIMVTKRSGPAYSIATSPWAPLIAISGQQQILLYDSQKLELTGVLPYPEGIAQILKFSRSGSLLLAGGGIDGASGKVVVFDVTTGERVIEVGDELDTVLAADISSDQGLIALGGPQKIVRVYSTVDGSLVYEIRKHTDWVYSLEFSPDSVLLATGDRAGGLYVWEAYTGREYLTLKGHTQAVTGVSWRTDSNVVASCSEDVTARLWEMENGQEIKKWNAHGVGTQSIEYTRDGRLVTCGRDKTTKLWDQNGAQQRAFPAFTDIALSCSFCDESSRVIAGDWTGEIRVWNAADGVQVGNLTANPVRLEARLTEANEQLKIATAENLKRTAAYNAVATASKAYETQLAAKKNEIVAGTAKAVETTALITSSKTKLDGETAKLVAATAITGRLEKAVPLIGESLAHANKAIAAAGDDKELKDVAAKLLAVHGKRKVELEKGKTDIVAATAAVTALNTENANYVAALAKLVADGKTLQAAVDGLTQLLATSKENEGKAKATVDEYTPQFVAAQAAQKRWTEEQAFATKIAELVSQKKAALAVVGEKAQLHANMQAAADLATTEMAAAKKKMEASAIALTDAAAKKTSYGVAMEKGTATLATMTEVAKKHDAMSKVLAKTLASLDVAQKALAASAAEDEAVKSLAATISSTLKAKQAELTTTTAAIVANKAAMDATVIANVEVKKQLELAVAEEAKMLAAMEVAKKEMADAAAKQQAAIAQAGAAKQELDVAETELAKVEQAIGTLRKT